MLHFTLLVSFLISSLSISSAQNASLATVYTSCTVPNTVALTFDDGPYDYLTNISDMLTAAGAKGSFFMNGNNWACIYDPQYISSVQYAYNAGHMIGDHTWAHADLSTLTTAQINDAMFRMEEAFGRIIGVKPAFMRPPYGDYGVNVRAIAYAHNQSVAMWDQDTGDADGNTPAQSEAVYTAAVKSKATTMNVLNHETYKTTAFEVLPFAIKLLQENGYQLVTLAECLDMDPYVAIGTPGTQNSSWTCDGAPGPGAGCVGNCETAVAVLSTTISASSTATSTTTSTSSTASAQASKPASGSGWTLSANGHRVAAACAFLTVLLFH